MKWLLVFSHRRYYFFLVSTMLRIVPIIRPMMHPTIKVNTTRMTMFQKLKGVMIRYGWRKCISKIRLRKFWNVVGMINTHNARMRCTPPMRIHMHRANFFLLTMK